MFLRPDEVGRQALSDSEGATVLYGVTSAAYWDGRNGQGEQVANRVYLYQMVADQKTFTRRMVVLK